MKFDIIIVGGGMVGGLLAYALSKGPWQIALIDSSEKKIEDARLIALNHGSCCLFENIGLWPALSSFATPIEHIHVSKQNQFGITRIDAHELGLNALGHVVPARHINDAITTALSDTKNVTVICPGTLTGLSQETDSATLTVKTTAGEHTYTCDIVIGADGSHSTVRELLGISAEKVDYQQTALVTVTQLTRDHQNIAYERFQEEGAIAMLPLTDQRVATIWTSAHSHIHQLMQLSDVEFLQELQQQFGYRLGRLIQVDKRATYPLQMQHVQQQQKRNAILIGNAAHTLHPIAAQGLNTALYEVAALAEYFLMQSSLTGCLQQLPLDSLQQNFSRRLSHGLTALFSKNTFPLKMVRQMAMIGFDQCMPLKKKFANHAMGKTGQVPRLFLKNAELLAK